MALNRLWIPSPCYHSRSGTKVRLIVLHTAEGCRTIEDLGHFFQNAANEVSSQVGADDKRGKIGEYVTRGNASWTQAYYNEEAVSMELCGFAAWSRSAWMNDHRNMLYNAADWIAEEAKKFGLPLTELSPSQAQGGGRGVCQHIDLGSGGGGHVDCGGGFPMDEVLRWAREGTAAAQQPGHSYRDEDQMFQLQFDEGDETHAPAAMVCWGTQWADGKSRLTFSCNQDTELRVDQLGRGPTVELRLGYDEQRQGLEIPEGAKSMVVRRDSGTAPVCCALSRA